MSNDDNIDANFVDYLASMVNLDALDRITRSLDEELKDSQLVMNQIKEVIDTLPAKAEYITSEVGENALRHEDISNFLSADTPKLLMTDMDESDIGGVDFDTVIASIKSYTEDLKKNLTLPESPSATCVSKTIEKLDLEPYATSLDQLNKRLSSLKLNKEENKRSPELEAKLSILCDDVHMLTRMVGAEKSLSEADQNWPTSQEKYDFALQYDNLMYKLLNSINEVSYLLRNKN